jgi:nucleoside-diphosphate-sugar epimerase
MRVLITGSSGFVGQHVVKELEDDHELITPDRFKLDLLKDYCVSGGALTNTKLMFEGVDAVVHLAATCGGIGINKDNPGKFIYENLQMGINVLEAARLANVKKVINLGTVCAYPKYTDVPFKESDLWSGYPEETNAPYGIAKKTIIEMARAYHAQYGMEITNLLPANMYGEYDNFDLYSSHVIPALIAKFENLKKSRDEIFELGQMRPNMIGVWGDGSASREFLHASDLARAVSISLEKNTGPEPINIGTGHEVTIKELVELINKVGGYDGGIQWDPSKPNGQPRRSLDITRAKNVLRWEPQTSLEEGLNKTIEWYRAHGK